MSCCALAFAALTEQVSEDCGGVIGFEKEEAPATRGRPGLRVPFGGTGDGGEVHHS